MTDQRNDEFSDYEKYGLMALYGGLTVNEICVRKGIEPTEQNIFELLGITERGALFFAITQAEAKIRREGLQGDAAKKTYQEIGQKVRDTIREIGNQMPETLP